jgi:type II secretory pathway component GspD/PulD (secretin)
MFIFRKTVSKESNSKYYISAPEKLYKFNSGFSLAVVPVIIENNILLKIRPCIRQVLGERGENEIYFQMREIITTLTVPSGKTEIIGGLESNYNETKYSFWSYIPILNRFFSGKRIQKKKSYIILFIKPKIIQ